MQHLIHSSFKVYLQGPIYLISMFWSTFETPPELFQYSGGC
uniref:Uncharacterized protein n=1 Tax=Arundo donax TaxID=35708 RepID=A0A0A9HMT6_ARUDO